MISWISNLIQKRGKVIFSVLLAIIIVAFVFTIGAGPGIVKDERTSFQNDFYGIDLNSQKDVRYLQNATMISRYINGVRQYDDSQFQQQMLVRQVRKYLVNTLLIPEPTEAQLRDFIAQKRNFQNESGQFEKSIFAEFIDSVKGGAVIDEAFVMKVLKEDYMLEQVDKLFASTGFVSPVEIASAVARDNTEWTVEISKLNAKNFEPEIVIDDEKLATFFQENQLRYEIPKHYTVSYVDIDVSKMPAPEEPHFEVLRSFFDATRTQYANSEARVKTDANGNRIEKTDDQVFVSLRAEILGAYNLKQQSATAVHMANDLIGRIFDEDIAYKSEAFNALLAEHNLELKQLPPFSSDPASQVKGVVPLDLFRTALRLDEDRYYSDVVANTTNEHFYVAFLDQTTPARVPELAEVKTSVIQDYEASQKDALFAAKGVELSGILNEAAATSSIEAASIENGLEFEKVEAFKLTERPQAIPFQILREIENLETGKVSAMLTADNFGYFIHVVEKSTPVIEKTDPAYTTVATGMNNYAAFARYQSLIQELINAKFQ